MSKRRRRPNRERVMNKPAVIGAGLAGCEAAWQLAQRGIDVQLFEMKPHKKSDAHHSDDFAELVCSNSLRSDRLQNAAGLLKEEMRRMDSLMMRVADETRVPAGGALAVDRQTFSRRITQEIERHPRIEVIRREVTRIPDGPCIVATGPLTSDALSADIARLMGEGLFFFDAAAPIVSLESLDMSKVFRASRYGKGDDDYLNCPMTREEYMDFCRALIQAETATLKEFDKKRVFEGCMPIEVMAQRGEMTLAFGPLKPVGLIDARTGKRPFAVVQLRQDNEVGTLFNMVGFQTHLTFGEQQRVFRMIPGLENAEFVRFGVMHRNTFIRSPQKLNVHFQCIERPDLFFAGQITGVEGYVESASSGLAAGICMSRYLQKRPMPVFTSQTAHGALASHVANYSGKDFQPMNIAFGIMEPLSQQIRNKQERYVAIAERAVSRIEAMKTAGEL